MSPMASTPHFLLFSESRRQAPVGREAAGQWRFLLESVDGATKLAACDEEPQAHCSRLELLAVVRGLEALDQPSRVTLVTPSRYVSRGIRYGLDEWRRNDWRWERYGRMTPVKNGDLWRRIDRALQYHKLDCRTWRFDSPDDDLGGPSLRAFSAKSPAARTAVPSLRFLGWLRVCARWVCNLAVRVRRRGRQCGGRVQAAAA
jgi:ribonuclease HI